MRPGADSAGPARPRALPAILEGKAVAVLGAGKVGRAAACVLRDSGLTIAAVTARSPESAGEAALVTGGSPGTDNAAAARAGDIVLVTTNDDAVATVAAEVAEAGAFRSGQLVVHMSGVLRLSALRPAAEAGAAIGSAHPMRAFATAEQAAREIRRAVFGVTAGPGAADTLEALVGLFGGHAVTVDDDMKAVYHAAAVMASNYLVALQDVAARMLVEVGFAEDEAAEALGPLAVGTMDNILEFGATKALTGPIVRGDVETVRTHVAALRDLPEDVLCLYRALGRHTLGIARRRGTLDERAADALRDALEDEGAD